MKLCSLHPSLHQAQPPISRHQSRLFLSGRQAHPPLLSSTFSSTHRQLQQHNYRQQSTTRIWAQSEPIDNLRVPRNPPKPATLTPSLWLSREDAVVAQLKALQHNNFPTIDSGIEIVYRFAGFDPWQRSTFFGRSLDLGQFERFRRIFYTKCFTTLLNHSEHRFLSSLEVAEDVWKVRVLVINELRKGEENVYEFTMRQHLGGKRDGFWLTDHLVCDGCDDKTIYGVI